MTRRPVPRDRVPAWPDDGRGLTAADAAERLRRHGPNAIVETVRRPWLDLARDTAADAMIWFLAGAAALYALVGQAAEAATLLAAIVPLVGMDVFLHRRTQASTQGLASRLAARATVVRDGARLDVPSADVVPGDLVVVAAGEAAPADGLVVAGEDLQADESTLTGEAQPAVKRPLGGALPEAEEPAVAVEHWMLAGTRLLTGRASVRIVLTGGETLYGEIVRSAAAGGRARTPLQRAIQRLVTVLVAGAAVACLSLAAVRLAQGHGWVDAAVSAVTLAAAALPEEFPVVFAFFLGVGVYRLARRQTLVRRAVSVENIGRVTTICSDKTGTITEGRLRLREVMPAGADNRRLLALAAAACRADAGDPVDAAVLQAAAERGVAVPGPTVARHPFTEARARESTLVRDGGATLWVVKGAPERVLETTTLDGTARAAWATRLAALASSGRKVLACAWQRGDGAPDAEPAGGYTFAGLLAFADPVREGVTEAVARCREAAIRTIMVTGDHALTATAVAREIGLGAGAPTVVSGDEIDGLLARRGAGALDGVDVVARAAPAQKLTLVRALQAAGEVVAVTGDGVNDVPALQAADVGIAMGERGTRPAREVAAIVLLDDNFRTIVRAVAEGRQLFHNLRASFAYLVMIHVPLVVSAAALPAAGYPLLYLPAHIVWLELLIHPTALLVFQGLPAAGRPLAAQRGRRPRFFSPAEWGVMLAVGALLTLLVVAGYLRSLGEADVAHGRSMALAVLAAASAAITAALSRLRTRAAWTIALGTLALTAGLIQTPGLAAALHVAPLHLDDWAAAAAGGALAGVLALALPLRGRRRAGPER